MMSTVMAISRQITFFALALLCICGEPLVSANAMQRNKDDWAEKIRSEHQRDLDLARSEAKLAEKAYLDNNFVSAAHFFSSACNSYKNIGAFQKGCAWPCSVTFEYAACLGRRGDAQVCSGAVSEALSSWSQARHIYGADGKCFGLFQVEPAVYDDNGNLVSAPKSQPLAPRACGLDEDRNERFFKASSSLWTIKGWTASDSTTTPPARRAMWSNTPTCDEIAASLRSRWTPERVKDFCRPETRVTALGRTLESMSSANDLTGTLYPELVSDIGEVHWRYSHLKNYVTVKKDFDEWILEYADPSYAPGTDDDFVMHRIDEALLTCLDACRSANPKSQPMCITSDDDLDDPLVKRSLLIVSGGEQGLQRDSANATSKYWRKFSNGQALSVSLDKNFNIEKILLDGKVDKIWNEAYKSVNIHIIQGRARKNYRVTVRQIEFEAWSKVRLADQSRSLEERAKLYQEAAKVFKNLIPVGKHSPATHLFSVAKLFGNCGNALLAIGDVEGALDYWREASLLYASDGQFTNLFHIDSTAADKSLPESVQRTNEDEENWRNIVSNIELYRKPKSKESSLPPANFNALLSEAKFWQFIENRWTPARLNDFCRPETRVTNIYRGGRRFLASAPPQLTIFYDLNEKTFRKTFSGAPPARDAAGRASWPQSYIVCATRGSDRWILEYGDFNTGVWSDDDFLENRLESTLLTSLDAFRAANSTCPKCICNSWDARDPVIDRSVNFSKGVTQGLVRNRKNQVIKYFRTMTDGKKLTVSLDSKQNIRLIFIDGKEDRVWNDAYKHVSANIEKAKL